MNISIHEEKTMARKFDERGKFEYLEQVLARVLAGELDQEEAELLMLMVEYADEDGNVSIPAELIEGA